MTTIVRIRRSGADLAPSKGLGVVRISSDDPPTTEPVFAPWRGISEKEPWDGGVSYMMVGFDLGNDDIRGLIWVPMI